jgi:glutaredoxin 3
MALKKANTIIQQNPLVVFSKSYCPYCRKVKELLKSLGANAKVIEVDQEKDGGELQAALGEISGQQTVPNVFIGGQHVGGCDATVAANNKGTLVPLLKDAGVLKNEKE